LATIHWKAFMRLKGSSDLRFGLSYGGSVRLELEAAMLADAKESGRCFDDAELALCHDSSLPPSREPVDFKRHHYPLSPPLSLSGEI